MANEVSVLGLVKDIKDNLKQRNSSQKDEISVMQAMLNDTSYSVDVYDKSGKIGEYCPADDFNNMMGSIISATTKISKEEAKTLAEAHEVTKAEAKSQVGISKQFIHTYLDTGRKLPLGGREQTNFALSLKDVPERVKPCPRKVGVGDDGEGIYETPNKIIPAHVGLKAHGSCPAWIKSE